GQSTIAAADATITTDETTKITVQRKEQYGKDLIAGGDTVTLSTTHGSLSTVTDNGDGTYSATLSMPPPWTATITGTVNGTAITDNAVVSVSSGAASAAHSTITAADASITTDE